jgi:hypothetical protein
MKVMVLAIRRGRDAVDFNFGPAEVDQQASGLAGRPQVVLRLLVPARPAWGGPLGDAQE